MTTPVFDAVQIGDELPEIVKPPITRTMLALFAGASGDHNPIHLDIDFAHKAKLDDVIAHGMLVMAYLGQLLTQWVPQQAIKRFAVRFCAVTHVADEISCRGIVADKLEIDGERQVIVDLVACDQTGEVKLSGQATVVLRT